MSLSAYLIRNGSLLKLADKTLCLVVFLPSMVFYWRGIWDLSDIYILPNGGEPLQHWVRTLIGATTVFGYFLLPFLHVTVSRDRKWLHGIVSRVFMYLYAALVMLYWRGVWGLGEYYLGRYGWVGSLVGVLFGHGLLTSLRVSRSLIFPPFVVTLDSRLDVLRASTLFRTSVDGPPHSSAVQMYALDCCLSQYLIQTLTILTWRCGMTLVDEFFHTTQPTLADIISLSVGFIMTIMLFLLDGKFARVLYNLAHNSSSRWSTGAFEDSIYIMAFIATIFTWRGAWNLAATYFIPDKLLGGWVNHVLGTVLLFLLQVFSYAGFCGCGHNDREREELTNDVFFSTEYLRYFLQRHSPQHLSRDQLEKEERLNRSNSVRLLSDGVERSIKLSSDEILENDTSLRTAILSTKAAQLRPVLETTV